MKTNLITALLGVVMVGCLISPCLAEFYISQYFGKGFTLDQDAYSLQPSIKNDLALQEESFESPMYYGFRAGYLLNALERESFGLEIEFLHAKAIADIGEEIRASGTNAGIPIERDLLLDDIAQRFDVSQGVNLLTLNLVGHLGYWKGQQFPYGRIQPYAGAGLGAVLIHPENVIDGNPAERYVGEGSAVQVFIGANVFLLKHLTFFSEYKFTHAGLALNAYRAEGDMFLNTHHIVSGLAVHF